MQHFYVGLFLSLLIPLMLGSCVEIIDFDTDREAGQLVVDGSIGTGTGPFELYLGRTADTERKTIPLEGAKVTLFDDLGNTETYVELGEGQYLLVSENISTEIGRTYYIRIQLASGEVYESKQETIPSISGGLDTLSFGFEIREELNEYGNIRTFNVVHAFVGMTVDQNAGENSYFRFDVEEVYRLSPTDFPDPFGAIPPPCYVYTYPDISSFELLDVKDGQTRTFTDLQVASATLDHRFDEKHYFNIYLRSLTEDAYTFWSQIDQISSVGTIFDTPPAPVQGNMFNVNDPKEKVLGYFSAMSSDTIRASLIPSETPLRPLFDCQYSPFKREYPLRCLNCLSLPGATYDKPDYF